MAFFPCQHHHGNVADDGGDKHRSQGIHEEDNTHYPYRLLIGSIGIDIQRAYTKFRIKVELKFKRAIVIF